jgi:hypothetical protein
MPVRDDGYYWVSRHDKPTPFIAEWVGNLDEWYLTGCDYGVAEEEVIVLSDRL